MSKGSKARKPSAAGKKSGGVSLPVMLTVLILGALVVLAWLMMDTSSAEPPKPKRAADGASTAPSSQFASSISLKEGECGDAHEMCEPWHKAGACARSRGAGAPPPAEMRKLCPHSCGDCPGVVGRVSRVPSEARCRRDNLTAAVPSGRLKPLFERLLSDFPQYTPAALSTDPYIVQLHDFLTADEMAAFQRVCKPNFERSLAGDQLNPCWCNFPGCFTDPDVHRVVRRINEVTGTVYNNGEDMQIVRYEPGQFYKVHHDQNTAVWAPQGPRVLTFFMYLNEVGGGGETYFPNVRDPKTGQQGIMVQPHPGSAILWPSTLDAEPMRADMRTNHEARAVTEGIKFGANMWIHQFDFKTPSERGCPLTYVNTVGPAPRDPEHVKLVQGYVPTYKEVPEPKGFA